MTGEEARDPAMKQLKEIAYFLFAVAGFILIPFLWVYMRLEQLRKGKR